MNTTILSTASGLRSDFVRLVRAHPRVLAAVAAVAAVLTVAGVALDWSATLSPADAALVRTFVIRTNSAAVRERYNNAVSDGRLSVDDVERVIEVSKREQPGYGLVSRDAGEKPDGSQ
ncbi:hypothetical protein [Cupriavidus pinatubonensis]|uniref:Transmembrane protein n=1 Tax=Cupriavidus pinatubonensis TaxID=248026 RepID=A0ABM8WQM2_9BURK|nr:hypothetical protein [Cupriavidus pinatubonensis]CAG9169757.1 hypothetical protein LMG23994_01648 [Cupriavidus pinatubonensis]